MKRFPLIWVIFWRLRWVSGNQASDYAINDEEVKIIELYPSRLTRAMKGCDNLTILYKVEMLDAYIVWLTTLVSIMHRRWIPSKIKKMLRFKFSFQGLGLKTTLALFLWPPKFEEVALKSLLVPHNKGSRGCSPH